MNGNSPTPGSHDAVWQAKHKSILLSAAHLFEHEGYEGTTMKAIAAGAGCSVGYLYKHFAGKQEMLDGLVMTLLDKFEAMRHQARELEGRVGLDCLRRELTLICRHFIDHRALIPVFAEREAHCSPPLDERMRTIRCLDQSLLDEARLAGEVPDMDPALLAAVIDGAVWSVLKLFAGNERGESFLLVPDVVDQLVFTPMQRLAREQGRQKESLS
ncbi:MAG: TetR/AcrR family transcriptional regulator [bacterium]|nr:TetR/AcrR family transcriptional regulator [bacterium]